MISDENLPDGWSAAADSTESDEMMDREYDSKRFTHESGEASVLIHEVEDPKNLEGWGYQVLVEHGPGGESTDERVGSFEELQDARDAAIDYMTEYSP